MLDDFFGALEQSFQQPQHQLPSTDSYDYWDLRQSYGEAMRQSSQDILLEGQQMLLQKQMHERSNAWRQYLESIDSMQGTGFRGSDLAGLEADILAAEQHGWRQGLG